VPTFRLLATATFGLESVVARELAALGYESKADRPGWLAFDGDASSVARANLWLRASDRVLLEMGAFPAPDFDALFEGARALPWEELLPVNARIPVRGRSVKSTLASVPACQRVVKKAIVERLKRAYRTASLPEDGPELPVEIALLRDEAKLLLDTSGPGLHKRGYRPESGASPLKETLAAGLVLLSFWNRDRPFLDPFCGTGTIAIEAALAARNRAPGLERVFVSEHWPALSRAAFERAREEARDLAKPPLAEPLEAFDRDESALAIARKCAERASVSRDVRFERKEFAAIEGARPYGCLVTNPPYGERSGDARDARELYRRMPEIFRRLPTWSFYVLAAGRDFESIVGQKADRRRKLYNGDLECTYYQFLGPRPGSGEAARPAFGGLDEKAKRQAELFRNRLKKRAHHLRKWPSKRETDCYRLYDRDVKEVPLAVDRYGDALLLTPTSRKLESRTRAEHEDWLDLMAATAAEALGVPAESVFIEGRTREPRTFLVREEGMVFEARLPGPPAFEPRLRAVRTWLRESATSKRVLVCDATLAVAAAKGGALSTLTVVPGAHELALAKRAFERNGVPLDSHRFAAAWSEVRGTFDLVVAETPIPDRLATSGALLVIARDPKARLPAGELSSWHVEDVTAETTPEEFRGKPHRAWRISSSARPPSAPRDRGPKPRAPGRGPRPSRSPR
jgi:23S rRNA (guanine2445-N2)-methyltransferase / 23S rRNA (guanine2069-N7)-methyltransferase